MEPWFVVIGALIALAVVAVILSLKVIPEYERGVVFRLGRLQPLCGPGLKLVAPLFERLERVDQRVVTLTIPPQEVITRDNVPARVNAVVLFNVVDPVAAVMKVENYAVATSQIAQTTLRSVLGRADLDTILAHRDNLNSDLRDIIEHQTQPCGVDVSVVEIKDVEMPEQMRGRWPARPKPSGNAAPKIINARGKLQASEELRQAADTLSRSPASLQLRYLQTLLELGADQKSTVVSPLPMDLIGPLLRRFAPEAGPEPESETQSGLGSE